jgi:hypothetical protein
MPDSKRSGAASPKEADGRNARVRDRLASALRENLKRRKAQARERAKSGQAAPGDGQHQ